MDFGTLEFLKVVLVGELPVLVEVADAVPAGETLLRATGRVTRATPCVLERPPRIESAGLLTPAVQGEADVGSLH